MQFYIPIQKVDEEKRLVYGVAIAEERDNANEIFDYESSKPYIAAWSAEFKAKTDGKSCGNLRAMHNAISAGKLTQLDFDDQQKAVTVCAKVIDDNEWEKVLEGIYTGFSFGGGAIRKWQDEKLNAVRYTLSPNELSLADKPCVPSAVFFDVVKVDGTTEKRQFKNQGGKQIVIKIQKNMDLTQFLELINNVKDGLLADEKTPENLMAAVNSLADVLVECTQTGENKTEGAPNPAPENPDDEDDPKKTIESGCATEKAAMADLAKTMKHMEASLAAVMKTAGIGDALAKMTKTLEDVQARIEKVEKQPMPAKVVKTVLKTEDGKNDPPEGLAAVALEEIKKAHNFDTCAY